MTLKKKFLISRRTREELQQTERTLQDFKVTWSKLEQSKAIKNFS